MVIKINLEKLKYTSLFFFIFFATFLTKGTFIYFLLIFTPLISLLNKRLDRLLLILFLGSIFIHFNPSIGNLNLYIWNVFVIIVFFVALIIRKSRVIFDRLEIGVYVLMLTFIVLAIYTNPIFSISLIKGLSIIIYTFIIFSFAKYINKNTSILLGLTEAIVLFNFFLIFTSIGYYPRNGLFMGVFDHSQTIGVYLVPLLMFYTIKSFEDKKIGVIKYVIIILGTIEIFSSYSRTAIFSFIIPIFVYFSMNVKAYSLIRVFFKMKYFLILITLLIFIVFNFNSIYHYFMAHLYKVYSNEIFQTDGTNSLLESRVKLYKESFSNFTKSPFIGNGFGIQKENRKLANNEIKKIPIIDIPYTMTNEKGNVYLMVLEEGGIITFFIFSYIIYVLLIKTFSYKPAFFSILSILLSFNGEASLFSLNGLGAYQLMMFFILYLLSKSKAREDADIENPISNRNFLSCNSWRT